MARKKGNKRALTSAERVRMHRQRKKLLLNQKRRIDEYFVQIDQNSVNVEATSSAAQPNTSSIQLKNQLRNWASDHRISKNALNRLLSVLQSNGMSSLPRNYRTLQETPINIESAHAAGGQLWHNGLRNCIENIFASVSRDITFHLKFNIDGLPIYKSSKVNFWPILASISRE